MTTTAHEDQYTVAPEPFRQPYDTVAILRQNVADLELALKQQTERAEKAEAELERLQEQEPVRWHVRGNYFHDGDAAILFASMNAVHGAKVEQLYAAPVSVPHKGETHCDDCGLTWLDDGLNPLGCPYCVPNHNARRYLALRENEVIIMQAADPDFDAEGYRARYDAAADRLLEGGA